jgi:hypothetical protein
MSKKGDSVTTNYESFLTAKALANGGSSSDVGSGSSLSPPIFILCDTCYWCATYFDKIRIPIDNCCPQCNNNNNELTSFPILSNESFTFDCNDKHGVELEFKPRRRKGKK